MISILDRVISKAYRRTVAEEDGADGGGGRETSGDRARRDLVLFISVGPLRRSIYWPTWEIPNASAIQKPINDGIPHVRGPPSEYGTTGSKSGSASMTSPIWLPGAWTTAVEVSCGMRRWKEGLRSLIVRCASRVLVV